LPLIYIRLTNSFHWTIPHQVVTSSCIILHSLKCMKDLMLQNKKRNRRGLDINAHPSKADEMNKVK
jgi:hypothetical protein